jgi:hypothetical protein
LDNQTKTTILISFLSCYIVPLFVLSSLLDCIIYLTLLYHFNIEEK